MVDLVNFYEIRGDDIVMDQLEVGLSYPSLHILSFPSEIVVKADDDVPIIHQVRIDETSTTCHQNSLLRPFTS